MDCEYHGSAQKSQGKTIQTRRSFAPAVCPIGVLVYSLTIFARFFVAPDVDGAWAAANVAVHAISRVAEVS